MKYIEKKALSKIKDQVRILFQLKFTLSMLEIRFSSILI